MTGTLKTNHNQLEILEASAHLMAIEAQKMISMKLRFHLRNGSKHRLNLGRFLTDQICPAELVSRFLTAGLTADSRKKCGDPGQAQRK